MLYEIINVTIYISNLLALSESMKLFICENPFPECSIEALDSVGINHGIESYDIRQSCRHIFRFGPDLMLMDREWKNGGILYPFFQKEAVSTFLLQAFYTHAVRKNTIQLHAALIEYSGFGIVFLGPSGIGKTTQAELWNRYRNARIINGDITFVQEENGEFWGVGTPWHGSSPYCENRRVRLKAMVVLKQGEKNQLRMLEGYEKVKEVSNSVFYPKWAEGGMELCLSTLDRLLRNLPVYELSCVPEEEAVALLERNICG